MYDIGELSGKEKGNGVLAEKVEIFQEVLNCPLTVQTTRVIYRPAEVSAQEASWLASLRFRSRLRVSIITGINLTFERISRRNDADTAE